VEKNAENSENSKLRSAGLFLLSYKDKGGLLLMLVVIGWSDSRKTWEAIQAVR
jgi:hypothetical protein